MKIKKITIAHETPEKLYNLFAQYSQIYRSNSDNSLYFTFKGLAGEESGMMGSKPHYHYISDKSGIKWDDLVSRIKDCDMPSSKVHIVIDRKGQGTGTCPGLNFQGVV